ncbi:MAG: hypothetical protein QOJ89_4966 [bacterium]
MSDEDVRALLAGVGPAQDLGMPVPPNMSAISARAVAEAGGDLDAVERWVKARLGWAKRIPPQFLPPDTGSADREALVFLVPDKQLEPGAPPPASPRGGAPKPLPLTRFTPPAKPAAPGAAPGGREPGSGAAAGGAPRPGPPPLFEKADLVALVPTTNLTMVKAFYGSMLGLPMTGESPIAVTFDANGTTLRCVLVEKFTPYPFTLIGWNVSDIEATVTELVARGTAMHRFEGMPLDQLGIWKTPGGARVAWFKDPFGNTISLTQF